MKAAFLYLVILAVGCGSDRILGRHGVRVEYQAADGPRPTPESAEQAATALSECPFADDVAPETWPTRRPEALAGSLRVPWTVGTLDVQRDQDDELWVGQDGTLLSFSVSDGAGSYVLAIDSDQLPVEETACRAAVAGHLAVWHLVSWPVRQDTAYSATARVVLRDASVLDLGVVAPTIVARADLLRALLSLELATVR